MKKIINFALLLLLSLSLVGCVDDEDSVNPFYEDPSLRYVYILNQTNGDIAIAYKIKESQDTITVLPPTNEGLKIFKPVYKKDFLLCYYVRSEEERILHLFVYTNKTFNQGIFIRDIIHDQQIIERHYKIKFSELEDNYNTIIIYDDDDTTKW